MWGGWKGGEMCEESGLLLERPRIPRTTCPWGSESRGHGAMARTWVVVMTGCYGWKTKRCSLPCTGCFSLVSLLRVRRPGPERQPSEKRGKTWQAKLKHSCSLFYSPTLDEFMSHQLWTTYKGAAYSPGSGRPATPASPQTGQFSATSVSLSWVGVARKVKGNDRYKQ